MIIPITIPKKKASVPCFVDDADAEKISGMRWGALRGTTNKTIYAVTYKRIGSAKNAKVYWMHRIIMDAPKGMDVDHIDGNGLNNRRSNLRVCTRKQNQANKGPNKNNTSGYKGVRWDKRNERWTASIVRDGKCTWLGSFSDKKEAALVWNKASIQLNGEFAYQNKIE